MNRLMTALLVSAALAAPVLAQDALPDTLVKHWKTSKKYMLALADQMPAADYSFKPSPEEMSFGQQLAHIAQANAYFFSTISGQKSPISKPANYDKATVEKLLNDSYDFCIASLEGLTPDKLHATYDAEGQKMAGFEILLLATDHTAHHRGQVIVYLRSKNIKPTEYQF
ncbi:MAG TPA: DinB family protein [Bryobacteraceae bacterium]|nr:DinB family protein [Bryobacteraceae bacterium]